MLRLFIFYITVGFSLLTFGCTSHTKIIPRINASAEIDNKVEVWVEDEGKRRRIGKGAVEWHESVNIYRPPTEVILKKKGCASVRHRLRTHKSIKLEILGGLTLGLGYGLMSYQNTYEYGEINTFGEWEWRDEPTKTMKYTNRIGIGVALAGDYSIFI